MKLVRPSKGKISSGWGKRSGAVGSSFHRGIDFSWNNGWDIYAAAAGTVTFTGFYGGWGNLTRIDHGKGYSTWYAHQSTIGVRKGQKVNAGQKIGVKGNTGTSAGAHLHFELRLFGVRINPTGKFTATAGDIDIITEESEIDMTTTKYVWKDEGGKEGMIIGREVPGGWKATVATTSAGLSLCEAWGVLYGDP